MISVQKKCLFGGALFAAGICAGTANAQFTITGNVPYGNYVGAFAGGSQGFPINAGFWDEVASHTDGSTARSYSDPHTIHVGASAAANGFAYALHFNYFDTPSFEVLTDTFATVSWDFTGDLNGPGGSRIDSFVSLDGPGGSIVFADLSNPIGSTQVTLLAGQTYSFFGQALAGDDVANPGASSYFEFRIEPCGFVNHSFETGDFSGWSVQDLTNPYWPLVIDPSTGIDTFGFGWGSSATHGTFTAFHGFDGNGATSGFPISISQGVLVNRSGLTFDWRAAWDLVDFCSGCADRSFDVVVRPFNRGGELARFNILTAEAGTSVFDTGQQSSLINLAAFLGQAVFVSFEWNVPDDFTGPAQFQFDNVCLIPCCTGDLDGNCTTDVLDFGELVLAFGDTVPPNVPPDFDGDGLVTVNDFGVFVLDFGCRLSCRDLACVAHHATDQPATTPTPAPAPEHQEQPTPLRKPVTLNRPPSLNPGSE